MKLAIIFLLLAGTAEAGEWRKGGRMIDMKAIIAIESAGDTNAWNKRTGARGLCQITPVCLRDYNRAHGTRHTPLELHEPEFNKRVGTWYMNTKLPQYLKAYRIPDIVPYRLVAYNAGIGRLARWHRRGAPWMKLPGETRRYVEKYKQRKETP